MKTSCILYAAVILMILFSGFDVYSEEPMHVRVITANVGNADLMNCGPNYYFKLCLFEWEKKIAAGIASFSPDIISLQEVYDLKWCETKPPEKDKRKVCYKYKEIVPLHQAQRLLGPEYTIVCDGRANFECIGVKKSFSSIDNCAAGEICRNGVGLTHDVAEGCDTKSVVFGIDINVKGKKVRVVNGHPSASSPDCRADSLKRLFEGYKDTPALISPEIPAIVMGDMNMDPYTGDPKNDDVAVWTSHVGEGKPFYYLSGIAEHQPPYPTDAGRTLDHMFTNFAIGKCVTLGMAPDTKRLEGLPPGSPITESPDHNALLCDLVFDFK